MARISEQPTAQPLTGDEELIAVQNGGNVKLTPAGLLKYGNQEILNGRITKTIAASNGDFVSFDELFGWIRCTPMISVELTVLIQPGTHVITDPVDETTYNLVGSQLSKIHFIGADRNTSILEINNTTASRGFIKVTNMYLGMSRLTINNIGQPAFIVDGTSSTLNLTSLTINDAEFIFTANRSHCELNDCMSTVTATGVYLRESSTLEWGSGSIDGGGTAVVGINCLSNCSVIGTNNPIIANTELALNAIGSSRIILIQGDYTLTNNVTDYNIPLNVFQGDGGYITDGNLDTSAGSGVFELTVNKNTPDGYAGLDATGKIPVGLLPDSLEEVLEFNDVASFPATGESSKLYIASNEENTLYRWALIQTGPLTYVWQYIDINKVVDGLEFT